MPKCGPNAQEENGAAWLCKVDFSEPKVLPAASRPRDPMGSLWQFHLRSDADKAPVSTSKKNRGDKTAPEITSRVAEGEE